MNEIAYLYLIFLFIFILYAAIKSYKFCEPNMMIMKIIIIKTFDGKINATNLGVALVLSLMSIGRTKLPNSNDKCRHSELVVRSFSIATTQFKCFEKKKHTYSIHRAHTPSYDASKTESPLQTFYVRR